MNHVLELFINLKTKRIRHEKSFGFTTIVVTYSQFDSNIRVFYVFLGFLKNT